MPRPDPRERPTASISSINAIHGACFFAWRNKSRTRDAPTPTNISTNSDPDTDTNGTPASPATALARSVLPVPGGPSRSTPRGILAPSVVKRPESFRNSTTSCNSTFAPPTPATSANVTPGAGSNATRAELFPKSNGLLLLPLSFELREIRRRTTRHAAIVINVSSVFAVVALSFSFRLCARFEAEPSPTPSLAPVDDDIDDDDDDDEKDDGDESDALELDDEEDEDDDDEDGEPNNKSGGDSTAGAVAQKTLPDVRSIAPARVPGALNKRQRVSVTKQTTRPSSVAPSTPGSKNHSP
mmetsp:Transcript_11763/g.25468  ORF Transcript_11763/g.25468 Transcript_11763/m.25468 type:complete len:298 (+) Transcript_11763:1056-1949(+)